MNEPLPDILSVEGAWPSVREDVLQLIAWGFQGAQDEIRQLELEEEITGLIRKYINDKLDDDKLPPRFHLYSAKGEDHVDDTGKLGKKRPRVDILIECSVGRLPRKRYRFEAKRCARKLFNSKYKIEWYAEGIAEYVAGIYARRDPEAGMLGLMQSDGASYWKKELSAHLGKDSALSCESGLMDVNLIPGPDGVQSASATNFGGIMRRDMTNNQRFCAELAVLFILGTCLWAKAGTQEASKPKNQDTLTVKRIEILDETNGNRTILDGKQIQILDHNGRERVV